ncbi:adenyl-nucleotide exchange factor [Melampsora americana]|nr:adenyl-nucleotide exchange factor [Melampsora americana]
MLSLDTKISDTKILDTKISGRTDVNPIQGYIEIFADPKLDIHQRINAGKELEELLQVLDNTKDLEFLGAWPKLVKLLEEPHHLIQSHTLWIIGTAVQDNPKSQSSFLKYDPIPLIINILNHSSHEETQAKALYCLSSTLKHVPSSSTAFTSFISASGFEALNTILKGPSMKLRIRTAVSINSLAMQPHSILQSLPSHHLFKTLLNSVSPTRGIPTGVNGEGLLQDDDYIERALRAITTIVLKSDPTELDTEEKQELKELIKSMSEKDIRLNRLEGAGVAESEWDSVLARIN